MKRLAQTVGYLGFGACALAAFLTGCVASLEGGATASSASANASGGSKSIQVSGLLTLKGPDIGSWWALTDASGVVWRLEAVNAVQSEPWKLWQNRRVEVNGAVSGSYLAIQVLRVNSLRLKPD